MDAPERRYIFEEMPPRSAAMRQMLPAIASQMIILIYNLTDTFYVGLLNEPAQSAALSVVFPLFTVLNAVANLFGVGGSIVLAQALGRREPDEAKRCSAMTFWNALAASLLLAALFAATASQMLSLCGARVENAQIAYDYARWVVVIGGPFTVMSNVLANLIRGEGNAVAASVGVSLGGVLNIVLDPFFIFPQHLNLGAQGAGIATAVSNMASCVFFLGYALLRKKSGVLSFDPAALREMRGRMGRILSLGSPSAAQHALAVISVAALTKFTSRYTIEAVAALGIVKKLDQLPLFFSLGSGSGLLPLLSYNHAAGNRERCEKIFRFGCVVSVGFCLTCTIVYELFAPTLVSIFIKDSLTISYGAAFLRRMVVAMPMMAFCNAVVTKLQAAGQGSRATIISVLRKGSLDLPFLFLYDRLLPLYGCMWVQPTVDAIGLAVALIFLYNSKKQLGRTTLGI